LLGATLFIPLPGPRRLIGWLALGERLSGEDYTGSDLEFLDSLSDQAAMALARSQTITAMERRVQELNALARIAQGINVTLNFDDVLELIYAQSTQIVSGNHFHLTLYNKAGGYYYHAFCLEDNDRLTHLENKAIAPKTTLEQEVIETRRFILTQDFQRECQFYGVVSPLQKLTAWVGVPLNTGVDTIGALSVGTDDPNTIYTQTQVELLQAIADQAAGAIVKARLLQETERRAQQLSTLNIIARQLASTLDLEPLLQNILDSAVSILDSEAGSLFLVDEQTGELVFRVTVGPVASNLVGQRLPPGTGVVGRVVTNRKAIIVNETQNSTQWNSNPDQQTGFQTRALLAVPLEVKERIIGVIEIINKHGGLPFTEEDQTLLTAFAGQAAVAIENARLYTLTDQELAARVEELSVMQRIDRELNASLEVNRAMRITLEWAMRQSRASAGFIGVVYENGLQMIAEQGLGAAVTQYQENLIPRSHPALQEVLASGQPQRITLEENDTERAFLPGARVQLVVPIRREANTIGLFLLESNQPDALQSDAQDFLSRLSDHAAIAIANSQLYAEVQAASVAKSDFVSFVAHELKNPMTSIKGYTELLSAGAVGPINDMQSNFLSTIRSNVERMSTLVSDLNDNAKIEAGRLRLEFKSTNVADIVDDVVRSTKRQIEDKKQTIHVEISPDLPNIWADRIRVAQVLTNLVSNAHKYTPEGGEIIVSAEKAANRWDPQGPPEVVHIWVKDNGIGISPEDQKKIFQRFFRSDDQKARESPGTGLGLNITKSLVEMQGGKIWFESEFRKGTTFHITVPVSEN
ncbi:MAG: GAF domain-containing protein, partial [Anaerolineales bacterium]